jgi:hypothetical protein
MTAVRLGYVCAACFRRGTVEQSHVPFRSVHELERSVADKFHHPGSRIAWIHESIDLGLQGPLKALIIKRIEPT